MPRQAAKASFDYLAKYRPRDTLLFLLGSRYCETDRLSEGAWNLFGQAPTGWGRVQAICDYVHRHKCAPLESIRAQGWILQVWCDGFARAGCRW